MKNYFNRKSVEVQPCTPLEIMLNGFCLKIIRWYVCCTCNGRVSRCCHIEFSFTAPPCWKNWDLGRHQPQVPRVNQSDNIQLPSAEDEEGFLWNIRIKNVSVVEISLMSTTNTYKNIHLLVKCCCIMIKHIYQAFKKHIYIGYSLIRFLITICVDTVKNGLTHFAQRAFKTLFSFHLFEGIAVKNFVSQNHVYAK